MATKMNSSGASDGRYDSDAASMPSPSMLSPEPCSSSESDMLQVAGLERESQSFHGAGISVDPHGSMPRFTATDADRLHTPVSRESPTPKDMPLRKDIFHKDVLASAVRTDLPEVGARVDKTCQLVFCIHLLHKKMPSDSGIPDVEEMELDDDNRERLKALRSDPMALDYLHWLAIQIAEEFINHTAMDWETIAEVVLLGPILTRNAYRGLVSCFVSKFDNDKAVLNIEILQGMVQLVQSASPGFLEDDDVVRILNALQVRLKGAHKASKAHLYQLVLAISRLLDVMVEDNVKGLNRTRDHKPLLDILSDLKAEDGKTDPYLKFQVNYAFQTLLYLPDDETRLEATMRYLKSFAVVASGVASVVKLDPKNVFDAGEHIQARLGKAAEVVKTAYENARSAWASGGDLQRSIVKRYRSQKKHAWYLALQALTILARGGQFVEFNKAICGEPCRFDRNFQRGVCQLLGEIAVDHLWDVAIRQCAVDFLGELYMNKREWSKHETIKLWIQSTLRRIISMAPLVIEIHASALLGRLQKEFVTDTQSYHPTSIRLPLPDSSPLLSKVLDIPLLEHDLHRLKQRRIKEFEAYRDGHPIYIPLQAKESLCPSNETSFPLLERVDEFLASRQQVLLVLGDSGAGKSTFNRHLEHYLWLKYTKEDQIPLHINLPIIDGPEQDLITKQLLLHSFKQDQIREMKLNRKFVLICDGYDESRVENNLHSTNALNRPEQWDVKMIISCRSTYLRRGYQDLFQPKVNDRYDEGSVLLFQEVVIMPFNEEQIRTYVEQRMEHHAKQESTRHVQQWKEEQYMEDSLLQGLSDRLSTLTIEGYMERLSAIPNMMELVRNPFLLKLSFLLDLSATESTRLKLYDDFVEKWIQVSKIRLQESKLRAGWREVLQDLIEDDFEKCVIEFLKRLADAIYDKNKGHGIPEVSYIHRQDKASWKEQFFGPRIETTLLREASPLTKADVIHKFMHQSLLEYFYALCFSDPDVGDGDYSDGDESDSEGDSDSDGATANPRDGTGTSDGARDDSGGKKDDSAGDRDNSGSIEDNSSKGKDSSNRDKDDSGGDGDDSRGEKAGYQGSKDGSGGDKDDPRDNKDNLHGAGDDDNLDEKSSSNKARRRERHNPFAKRNLLKEPSVLQFLVERAQQDRAFTCRLLSIIHKSNFNARNKGLAAANAITILVQAGEGFSDIDLSRVRIPGDYLPQAGFTWVKLIAAGMTGADLVDALIGHVKWNGDPMIDKSIMTKVDEDPQPMNKKEQQNLLMQQHAIDRLTVVQGRVQAILTKPYGLHECPIPRLFIVLPKETSNWDPTNIFNNQFRLHFLCEGAEHTQRLSCDKTEMPHHIHLADHEGYDLQRPREFFQKYGSYMLTLLELLKYDMTIAGSTIPATTAVSAAGAIDEFKGSLDTILTTNIDRAIEYLQYITEPSLIKEAEAQSIAALEALDSADLRHLSTFIKGKDERRVLGNLYRILPRGGHVKWVCVDHFHSKYEEKEQQAFAVVVAVYGGSYDPQLGRAVVKLRSRDGAAIFFGALTKARRIDDLDVTFDWECEMNSLGILEDALNSSRIAILRLDLRHFRLSLDSELLPTATRFDALLRVMENPRVQMLHVVLPMDSVQLFSFQPRRPYHHRNLTFEMLPGSIGKVELGVLQEALRTTKWTLTTLNLQLNSIGDSGAQAISKALKSNSTLTTLNLRYNSVGEDGAHALSEALKTNSTLSTLDLESNSIGDKGAYALSEALKANSTLTTLNLGSNSIKVYGALVLFEALNSSLTSLDLSQNSIRDNGAHALSEALKTNATLTTLNLQSTSIGDSGAQALSEALKINSTLTTLDLQENSIGDRGAQALSEALKTNSALTTLSLQLNSIEDSGAQALSEALKINSALTTLSLQFNSIEDSGAQALFEALTSNSTLATLGLREDSIGGRGAQALSEVLKINSTLTTLDLDATQLMIAELRCMNHAGLSLTSTNLKFWSNLRGTTRMSRDQTNSDHFGMTNKSIGDNRALVPSEILTTNLASLL
ncbi:hypothetical protein BGX28_003542 [Mortierella sp. GBA30]|nr:hypothetical protein BGX28_003542 [Mortierella sp. GBA30]